MGFESLRCFAACLDGYEVLLRESVRSEEIFVRERPTIFKCLEPGPVAPNKMPLTVKGPKHAKHQGQINVLFESHYFRPLAPSSRRFWSPPSHSAVPTHARTNMAVCDLAAYLNDNLSDLFPLAGNWGR